LQLQQSRLCQRSPKLLLPGSLCSPSHSASCLCRGSLSPRIALSKQRHHQPFSWRRQSRRPKGPWALSANSGFKRRMCRSAARLLAGSLTTVASRW
jgi:hypothetical protein